MARRKRLGEALIEANIISQEQLEDALRFQEEKSKLLGQILIDMGWVTEEDVYYAMSKVLNVDYVNLDNVVVNREAIRLVPQSLAVDHNTLPFFIQDGKILHLAMENPLELPRTGINGVDNLSHFVKKLDGCYDCISWFWKKKKE